MKFKDTYVYNIYNAVLKSRNSYESWDKSDSTDDNNLGPNDIALAQRLIKAGPSHSKFMRQIFVSVDITAPLYLWKELDQYRIGVTTNSESTMHTIERKPITLDLFETGDYDPSLRTINDIDLDIEVKVGILDLLEQLRQLHLGYKDLAKQTDDLEKKKELNEKSMKYWKELIRWLPESWLQMRTTTMSYENIRNIVMQRNNHRLSEWDTFISWATTLPYAKEFIFCGMEDVYEKACK